MKIYFDNTGEASDSQNMQSEMTQTKGGLETRLSYSKA